MLLKLTGKSTHLVTLPALVAIHMQGLAHYDLMHFIVLDKASKNFDIVLKIFAANRRPPLGGQEQSVTHRNSNIPIAQVESHNPHIFMIQPMVPRAIINCSLELANISVGCPAGVNEFVCPTLINRRLEVPKF